MQLKTDNDPTLRSETNDRVAHRHPQRLAEGRDGSAMSMDDTGRGDPSGPEVLQHGEQPQGELAGQAPVGELELDAHGLPIENRPTTIRTYLLATAGLICGLVSVTLVVAEVVEYANHSRISNPALYMGQAAGIIGVVVALVTADDAEKQSRWAERICKAAFWLGGIGFLILLLFDAGLNKWSS
jgi:hypothetical protein